MKALTAIALMFLSGSLSALPAQSFASMHSENVVTTEPERVPQSGENRNFTVSPDDFKPTGKDYRSRVLDLIAYSIGFYMQELILWEKPTVTFRHPVAEQFGHLNEIVRHSLELYDHPAKDSFWGFSGRLEKQLLELQEKEGYYIDHKNATAPRSITRIGYNDLRHRIQAIEKSANAEVEDFIDDHPEPIDPAGNLIQKDSDSLDRENQLLQSLEKASRSDVALLIDSLFELEEVPHGLIGEINERIRELESGSETDDFKKNQPLDPIAFLIETESVADETALAVEMPKKMRKEKSASSKKGVDFNARVLELLEENNRLMSKYNDRFDYMQSQIDDLKEAQQNVPDETEQRLQKQIDEIHTMISDLGKGKSSGRAFSSSEEKLKPVEIVFERNDHSISLFQKTILNEMIGGLLKNPSYKVMITGFADASGDRKYNVLLSQKRAQAVRNYFVNNGINTSRLVVNYLGDNKSTSPNPLDRKVEIEWVPAYGAATP